MSKEDSSENVKNNQIQIHSIKKKDDTYTEKTM